MGVLRARVGGAWVDVSGVPVDAIWVDPNPPTDPTVEMWYDTDALWFGPNAPTGGAAGSVLAKNSIVDNDMSWQPLGIVGRPAIISTDQTGITTLVDLTGFTATINVVAGRLYEASWVLNTYQGTVMGTQVVYISLDGAANLSQYIVINAGGIPVGDLRTYSGSMVFNGGAQLGVGPFVAAGSRVIKLRGQTNAGSMNIGSNGYNNGRFWVKDIGPAV